MKALLLFIGTVFSALNVFAAAVELETNISLYPIPAPGLSCAAMNAGRETPDLAAPHISISEVFITNNTNANIIPTSLTFKEGSYTCVYSGNQLKDLGLAQVIHPNERAQIFCNMKCGGIPFSQRAKFGYLTFEGYSGDNPQGYKVTTEIQMMN